MKGYLVCDTGRVDRYPMCDTGRMDRYLVCDMGRVDRYPCTRLAVQPGLLSSCIGTHCSARRKSPNTMK